MNDSNRNTLLGVLWGIALGMVGGAVGGGVGFSLFGLYLFADTLKTEMLIGGSAFLVFLIVFFVTFFYWKKREVPRRKQVFIFSAILLMFIEIACFFGVVFWLNGTSARMYPSEGVISDTTLEQISSLPPGIYHVVAQVKENSITCILVGDAEDKSCVEGGHLVFFELPNSEMEVHASLTPHGERVRDLIKGQTYDLTIEKKRVNDLVFYYLLDFKPYGLASDDSIRITKEIRVSELGLETTPFNTLTQLAPGRYQVAGYVKSIELGPCRDFCGTSYIRLSSGPEKTAQELRIPLCPACRPVSDQELGQGKAYMFTIEVGQKGLPFEILEFFPL